jgi:hypothetical protein
MGVGLETGPHGFIKALSIIFARDTQIKKDHGELSLRN